MKPPLGSDHGSGQLIRIPELDGLRGLAILLVLWFHCNMIQTKDYLPPAVNFFLELPKLAWGGVDLFFVLSGFLITTILCKSRSKTHYFRNFYMRRVLRLAPVYYFVLISLHALSIFCGQTMLLPSTGFHQVLYYLNLANVSIFLEARRDLYLVMDVSWSLSVEEQFYALWSVLVHKFSNATLLTISIAIIVISPFLRMLFCVWGRGGMPSYVALPTHMDGLAWGCVLSVLWQTGLLQTSRKWIGPLMLTSAAAATCMLYIHTGGVFLATDPKVLPWGISIISIMSASLVLIALRFDHSSAVNRVLRNKVLQLLGKHSYAMYLTHQYLIVLLTKYYPWAVMQAIPYPLATPITQLTFLATVVASNLLLARILWYLLEKPCQTYKLNFD